MRSMVVWVLLLALGLVEATFDCRRMSQACVNGVCTLGQPLCDCQSSGFEGYDCALDSSSKTTCSICTEGQGTCYTEGAVDKCYCGREYYGETCDRKRFDVYCTESLMVIGINPYGTFAGIAYIEGMRGTPVCESVVVPVNASDTDQLPDTWDEGRYIEVLHNSSECGSAVLVDHGNGTREFIRTAVVRYDTEMILHVDDLVTARCVMEDNVTVAGAITLGTTHDGLNPVPIWNPLGVARLYILSNGMPITNSLANGKPVLIGEELRFVIGLEGVYTHMRIEYGEATDNRTGTNKTLVFIRNGCMTPEAMPVTKAALKPNSVNITDHSELVLYAFRFEGSDEVLFSFDIKVCVLADADRCAPATCTGGEMGYGRRRRDAAATTTLEQVIKIRDTASTEDDDSDPPAIETECRPWEITLTLIVMAVALFFLLFVCVVLIVIIVMSRRRRCRSESMTNLTASSVTTEKPPLP
ncbi:EGF-like domain-containing protein 2 [Haliotis cracherodii]|uniref:EGF-like domain-containing protein 2 n=1 Tax=Haliotis cracherodii TaxID=6455 RepID=UPI0039ED4764